MARALLRLRPRTEPGFSLAASTATMTDLKRDYGTRTYRGALRVAFLQRIDEPTDSMVAPEGEKVVKTAIERLLGVR